MLQVKFVANIETRVLYSVLIFVR